MSQNEEHLQHLTEIRSLMERSSRFISLSGLSGVFAGITALAGAGVAFWCMDYSLYYPNYYNSIFHPTGSIKTDFLIFFFATAGIVALLAIGFGIFFTTRQAKKKGLSIWDHSAKQLIVNLFLPLAAGGLFCLGMIYHNDIHLVAPATLIFYGLALLNASKYTLTDIRYLGLTEIFIGLIATIFVGYGLLFWAIGFGLMHIIYGVVMYYKYER